MSDSSAVPGDPAETTADTPVTPPELTPLEVTSTGVDAVHALRARRKRNRLGDMEWFDAAYRVYIVGLFGLIALGWLSDLVGDAELSASAAANVADSGPAVLGIVAIVALAAGLRGGSQGGPLALEAADVTYVMMAPIPRRTALTKPAYQRARSAAFAVGLVAAALAQLGGRRLPGSPIAWFFAGALFGAAVGLLWVAGALIAHELRLPLVASTVIGLALVGWQAGAATTGVIGPADTIGSVGLWGWRQNGVDVVGLVVVFALLVTGFVGIERLSIDALARRSSLVAQLRFAVTMQDLRTVILLRRQLSYEHTRTRPWVQLRLRPDGRAVWRRGWHSLLRLPTGRVLRMAALAVIAGVCQVAVIHDVTPALFGTMLAIFVLGLEVMEPLSQEVDQPDRTASFPLERGHLMLRHLAAPAVALVPFGLLAGIAAVTTDALSTDGDRVGAAAAVVAVLMLPTVLAGAAGATVSIVRDVPDPVPSGNQDAFMPPEMAGFTTVLKTALPLVVPLLGTLSILPVRAALADGADAALATATRMALGLVLVEAAVVVWVRHRDRVRRKIRAFMEEGRTVTAQQRATRSS